MPRGRTLDLRWTTLINEFRRGGLTQAEFCNRRGLSIHSFRKHLYGTSASKPSMQHLRTAPDHGPQFLRVTVLPDPVPSITFNPPALELILSNGRRIAVASGFNPETLRRLLSVVDTAPCSD